MLCLQSHRENILSEAGIRPTKFMPIGIISTDYSLCTEMDSTHASLCLLLAPKVLQFFSVLEHSLLSEILLGGRGHHHLFILVYLTTEHNLYNDK